MRSLPVPSEQPCATTSNRSQQLSSTGLATYAVETAALRQALCLMRTACASLQTAVQPWHEADAIINAQVVVQKRMDGCTAAGIPAFSFAKAFTCVSMGLSSRAFRDKYTSDSSGSGADPAKYCQMLSMVNITGGKMAPFPVRDLWRAPEEHHAAHSPSGHMRGAAAYLI